MKIKMIKIVIMLVWKEYSYCKISINKPWSKVFRKKCFIEMEMEISIWNVNMCNVGYKIQLILLFKDFWKWSIVKHLIIQILIFQKNSIC